MNTFKATFSHVEDDEWSWFAGLADSQYNTKYYVSFQRSKEVTEDDIDLGMDQSYVEINDQKWGGYGLLEKVVLRERTLTLFFNESGREIFEVASYEVTLDDGILTDKFLEFLREILQELYQPLTNE